MAAVLLPGSATPSVTTTRGGDSNGFFTHHGIWAPGVRLFRNLGFAAKALILSLTFLVPLVLLVGWLLKTNADESMRARMDATRQHVEVAHGIVEWAYAQETGGHLSHEAAQATAMQAVKQLRYDTKEYFWINDMQPRMVMHPFKPELDGKDLGAMKDPNGLALFKAMVDTVRREGKGFVAYQWPKPGSDKPVDKISYVSGFEPWGWVIGSGVYVGDLREAMEVQVAWAGGVVVSVLLFAGYLFLSFYRVMDGGLKETRRHLSAMAQGDLTSSPSPWGRDEAAHLMLDLRNMQQSLIAVVQRVRHSCDEILHSSGEVATASMDLSARTERAASHLETAAASMGDILATVNSGARLTEEATQVARHNAEVAADGGRVMREVITTMDGIRGSSSRISEIISTIDGIAFQTNILALNAAVEAARAGDQGRGFAVVASEVRVLAQRSAEAARQIKRLIDESVAQVEAGTGIVQRAGSTIDEIVLASQRVDRLLGEIATGARTQGAGITRIGTAVTELETMTQQNAALVEETAAASAAMNEQAHGLVEEVSHFHL
jgi:methyl-accepting chemotaxis protein